MRKRNLAILTILLVTLSFSMGCRTLNGAIDKYVPTIESGSAELGIGIKIDVGAIAKSICLTTNGAVLDVFDKIPLAGGLLKDLTLRLVGTCE